MSTPMMSPPFSHNRLLKTSIISIMRQRRRYGAAHKGGDTGGVVGGAMAETEKQQHLDRTKRRGELGHPTNSITISSRRDDSMSSGCRNHQSLEPKQRSKSIALGNK
ncbi:hypothetical protein F2Q70_00008860 [Brassica cretica]|uniref:Uncharacterized protein n=1 Tax=Brassica cretica TaxID=69181 RepID=A0A8S9M9Y9_BRACR|nr:hypothetical protein F2Q70_00008860 [Brassica cretica]